MSEERMQLGGQLLLAMPALNDPNFHGSVVLLCEHGEEGALGLIVNRPMQLQLGVVLKQLGLPAENPDAAARPVFSGGPVEAQRGFVVHDAPGRYEGSLDLGSSLAVSSSEDVLTAIGQGTGPTRFMIVLGYAGWGPDQLEGELRENAWLSVPATPELVFDVPVRERWRRAAIQIGVDPLRISPGSGNA